MKNLTLEDFLGHLPKTELERINEFKKKEKTITNFTSKCSKAALFLSIFFTLSMTITADTFSDAMRVVLLTVMLYQLFQMAPVKKTVSNLFAKKKNPQESQLDQVFSNQLQKLMKQELAKGQVSVKASSKNSLFSKNNSIGQKYLKQLDFLSVKYQGVLKRVGNVGHTLHILLNDPEILHDLKKNAQDLMQNFSSAFKSLTTEISKRPGAAYILGHVFRIDGQENLALRCFESVPKAGGQLYDLAQTAVNELNPSRMSRRFN